jgi:Xaa-Pro dipeptidase
MNSHTASEGRAARHDRLRSLMQRRRLGAILLRRPANFAWFTGGADNRVDHVASAGAADIVVDSDHARVLTSTIEAPRMRSEQTPDLEVLSYPWHRGPAEALEDLVGDLAVGADMDIPGAVDVSDEVARLRRPLDPDAIARLRAVGEDTDAAMSEAAASVEPGMNELEAAAALAYACRRRGLDPTVLLAAADERIRLHRHPIPVGARIERRVMLVASAERGGLYANLTRIVEFEAPDGDLARRSAACTEILGRMRDEATRPGRTLAEAFEDCKRFYDDAGFPGEWERHHQGGVTGYASREVIATPDASHVIGVDQAFAWNPSVAGAKAEETFVLTEAGAEVVAGAALGAVA